MKKLNEAQKDQVRELVSEKCNVDTSRIIDKTELHNELGIDSLDIVELVMELEEMFNCTIPDEDYQHTITFGKLIEIVENRM